MHRPPRHRSLARIPGPLPTLTAAWLLALACLFVAPAGAATLLVANKSDATVDLIDLASGTSRATLPTGEGPHEVAVSPDGTRAVISNYGVRGAAGSTLTVVDVVAAKVLRTIELGDHTRPHGLVWRGGDEVVVTAEGSKSLLVVDLGAGEIVRRVGTDQEISHMVAVPPGSSRAFVANIGSGSVTVIDLERGEKIADLPTGEGAEGITVSPDGERIWVTNRTAGTLSVIDPESLAIERTVACPGVPIRIVMTPDGERVLVSAASSGDVVLIDAASGKELARRKLDLANAPDASTRLFGDRFGESPVPVGLVMDPDGSRAWVAATQADAVVVIDPATLEVKGLLKAGREPDGMAWSPVTVPAPGES